MPPDSWLREMTDAELVTVAREAEERGVDPKTRSLLNDELRRRKLPALTPARWD